jgi:predicted RNase H-like HicB family nuclease
MKQPLVVAASWDDEAKVWVATSDDVLGLATEASTFEALVEKLKRMIPELLDANGHANSDDEVPFQLRVNEAAHRATAS